MKRLMILLAGLAVGAALAIPAFGATKTVSVRDDFFSPKSTSVRKDTTVRWVWRDDNPHNVTVTKGPVKFKSTTKRSGRYSKKVTRRGTYTIVCTIHLPGMRMKLVVK